MTPDKPVFVNDSHLRDDRKIPLEFFLDAAHGRGGPLEGGSAEKRAYLQLIADLVWATKFPPGKDIAVLGVGSGGEPRMISEILTDPEFAGGEPRIISIDYNDVIITRLEKKCGENPRHAKVLEGTMILDVTEMD